MEIQNQTNKVEQSIENTEEPLKKKLKFVHLASEVGTYRYNEEHRTKCISDLPLNVLVDIFKYLEFKSICYCSTLCKNFYNASNDSLLYQNITLKYTIDKGCLDAYIRKVGHLKRLTVEYKFYDKRQQAEDYSEFNKYVIIAIKKYRQNLSVLTFNSCRSEEVLQLLSDCPNLTTLNFFKCKASFEKLPLVQNLTTLRFACSDVPNSILNATLKNNSQLRIISLSLNKNLYVNGIAKTIAEHNHKIEEIYFCEKRRIRAEGMRAIARCNKLRILELTGGLYQCDPEDSLQHMAAGCPLLERLVIYGWKGINDDNLLPILQCCIQLLELGLSGIDITIKSCREAALSLPKLRSIDIYNCQYIQKSQIQKLQRDFLEIKITNG